MNYYTQLRRDAQAVLNTANDYAADYGMHVLDLIWDVTKEYRNNSEWSDAYALEVWNVAEQLAQ